MFVRVHPSFARYQVQLLLCGKAAIDVDDWERHTRYDPPEYAHSRGVAWFWRAVPVPTLSSGHLG